MHGAARRVSGIPWPDITIAALLVAAALTTTVADRHVLHPLTEAVAMITAASVVLRTRAPLAMTVIASAGCVVLAQLPGASTPLWAFATVLILGFSIGAHLAGIRMAVALALILAATYIIQARADSSLVELLLTPPIIVGAPASAGWLLARARSSAARLRTLTVELAEERERVAELAAETERARIARDLHDILAHTLSSIAVQAGAAQQLLPVTAPAREPVEHILTSAHDALDEVRSLLATARGEQDTDPRPGLSRLADLAAADGAALIVRGAPVTMPAGVSLAAFRIVQEALTNARRHAPGEAVTVTVDYAPTGLSLAIDNTGSPANPVRPGRGLVGMVERASAYGGSVHAGPRADTLGVGGSGPGGWSVRAQLPYEGAAHERLHR